MDTVGSMMSESTDIKTRKAMEAKLHFDLPLWKRYTIQLIDLSPILVMPSTPSSVFFSHSRDYSTISILELEKYKLIMKSPYFGRSFQTREHVSDMISRRLPITVLLATLTILLASLLGVYLGLTAAIYKDHWIDRLILGLSSIGVSAPSFFVGIFLAFIFGYYLSDYTGLSFRGSLIDYDDEGNRYYAFRNLILPVLTLSLRPLAMITQLTRSAAMEILHADYIRTAYAKGLSRSKVIRKHLLPNIWNPLISSISGWLGSLLGGAYFVEVIFDLKGIGSLTVDSILRMDIPVVLASSLTISASFILISFIVNFLYTWVDPRLRYE